jgi:large subunit ribosomal protein L10
MDKNEKERVVDELTARLREVDTLIVADYRGLTMPQIDSLRSRLIEHGARFTVVKNTLTRRAAEAAGTDALLALLEGPSAIAFIESDGDMVAVAKALADSARETKVLEIRGGLMQGRTITAADVEELAKLPPFDVLRGQVLGAIIGPLQNLLGLVNAPLQNLVGLIDARIEQLGGEGTGAASPGPEQEPESGAEQAVATETEAPADEVAEAGTESAAAAEAPAAEAEEAGGGPAAESEAPAVEAGEAGAQPAAESEAPAVEAEEMTEGPAAEAEAQVAESDPESEEANDVGS